MNDIGLETIQQLAKLFLCLAGIDRPAQDFEAAGNILMGVELPEINRTDEQIRIGVRDIAGILHGKESCFMAIATQQIGQVKCIGTIAATREMVCVYQ